MSAGRARTRSPAWWPSRAAMRELAAARPAPRRDAQPRAPRGRERHRQGPRRPLAPLRRRRAARARSSRSTAPRSRGSCSSRSCSATRRAPSPTRATRRRARSRWRPAGTLYFDQVQDLAPAAPGQAPARGRGAAVRARGRDAHARGGRALRGLGQRGPRARRCAAGRFREDLFHRLNVVPLRLEPLRDRREDVLPLADAFLARERERGHDRAPRASRRRRRELLRGYLWPGNVRELRSVVERAALVVPAGERAADGAAAAARRAARDAVGGARPPAHAARTSSRPTSATCSTRWAAARRGRRPCSASRARRCGRRGAATGSAKGKDGLMDQKKAEGVPGAPAQKKQEILEAYNKNKSYGKEADGEATQDIADKAANSYTKEFLFSLSNTERDLLQQVDEALARLEGRRFGVCAVVRGGHEPRSASRRCPGRGCASPARRSRSPGSSERDLRLDLSAAGRRADASSTRCSRWCSRRPARPAARLLAQPGRGPAVRAVLGEPAAPPRASPAAAACRSLAGRSRLRRAAGAGVSPSPPARASAPTRARCASCSTSSSTAAGGGRRRRLAEALLEDAGGARRWWRRATCWCRCRCTRGACASAASTSRRSLAARARAPARRTVACPDALVRRQDTAPQAGLTAAARRRNVRGGLRGAPPGRAWRGGGDARGRRAHHGRDGARLRARARRRRARARCGC